jgi:hypothetical protein
MSTRRQLVFLCDFLITCSGSRVTVMRMNNVCRTSPSISCYFWALLSDRWLKRAVQSVRRMKAHLHLLPRGLGSWAVLYSGCILGRIMVYDEYRPTFSEFFQNHCRTSLNPSTIVVILYVLRCWEIQETVTGRYMNFKVLSYVYSYLIRRKKWWCMWET